MCNTDAQFLSLLAKAHVSAWILLVCLPEAFFITVAGIASLVRGKTTAAHDQIDFVLPENCKNPADR